MKQVFLALTMMVHGWTSMLANNTMDYDEAEIIPMREMAFDGMVGAMKMGDERQ